jgi:hypothetical protein
LDIFNPQFLSQYAKLDSIQVIQFLMLILIGGLAWINLRQQGLFRQSADNNSKTTSSLLTNMQTQQTQSNDRENKLATAIDRQATESKTVGRILMLMHKEQKRQNSVSGEQHTAMMKRFDELETKFTQLQTAINNNPNQQEIRALMDQIRGYIENFRLKNRTSETPKLSTGEVVKIEGARSEKFNGDKLEVVENPT